MTCVSPRPLGRILGSGFNAIDGNPLPGFGEGEPGCGTGIDGSGFAPGQPGSCCGKTSRANTCGAGIHNPVLGKGNCVEIRDRTGAWSKMAVRSLTPAMIETSIPTANALPCIGGQGEMIQVSKRGATNPEPIAGTVVFCTNADQF